jgi:flagellar protein FliL
VSSPAEAPDAVKAAAPPGNKNALLLALVGMNLVGILGLGAYIALAAPTASASPGEEGGHGGGHASGGHGDEEEEEEGEAGPVVEFPTLVVNLADEEGSRYLKMTFQMELATEEAKEHVEPRIPRLRDAVLSYLSGLHAAEVRGSTHMAEVRDHLQELTIERMGEEHVKRVFLTEYLVQ